jgi:hypothetical protein
VGSMGGTSLDNLIEKTITTWIKLNAFTGPHDGIAAKDSCTGPDGGWYFMVSNTIQSLQYDHCFTGDLINNWTAPSNAIKLHAWHHVVIIYNAASTANIPRMYIDGLEQTVTVEDAPTSSTFGDDSAIDVTIGRCGTCSGAINGLIDDVRIYNRALTENEIKRLYNLGR